MGLAIKMEEYVPAMTPINKAKQKYLIVVPPKIRRAAMTLKVVTDVCKDRDNIC